MSSLSKIRRSRGFCEFRDATILASDEQVARLDFRPRVLRIRSAAVIGIFFAVDRCHMRRIFIEIRPPDSKLLAVRIDPFPQIFT